MDMTVVAGRSTIPIQRPQLRPAEQDDAGRPIGVRLREGLRDWAGELLARKRLLVLSLAFVVVGLAFDYVCGMYVHTMKGVKVPDLILDLFNPIDLSFLFIYGYVSLIVGMFVYPIVFRCGCCTWSPSSSVSC